MSAPVQPRTAPPAHLDLDQPFPVEWHAALTELAVLAVAEVRGCGCVAITVTDHGVPFTATSTSAQARAVDQAQYRPSDGPCLTASASPSAT